MSEAHKANDDVHSDSVHIHGDEGEEVTIGPDGIHVKDGDAEVKVGFTGIRIRDGKTRVNINVWKPLAGCALAIIVFFALLTFVIAGIIRLVLGIII